MMDASDYSQVATSLYLSEAPDYVCHDLAETFSKDPHFDRAKFLDECGVS